MGDGENDYEKVLVLPLSDDSKRIAKALSNDTSMKILDLLAEEPMSATAIAEKLNIPLTTVKYNLDTLVESDLIKVKEIKWSKKGRQIKIYDPVQKIIVVAPGKSDRSSIMGMLQKYLGMVVAALFAATGIEYLSRFANVGTVPQAAMEAESGDLLMGEPAIMAMEAPLEDGLMMEEASYAGSNATMYDAPPVSEAMDVAETGYVESADVFYDESIPLDALNDTGQGVAAKTVESVQNNNSMPPEIMSDAAPRVSEMVPPESTGLIPFDLASHVGVWFFFGCMFIIIFMLLREVYNRKRSM